MSASQDEVDAAEARSKKSSTVSIPLIDLAAIDKAVVSRSAQSHINLYLTLPSVYSIRHAVHYSGSRKRHRRSRPYD